MAGFEVATHGRFWVATEDAHHSPFPIPMSVFIAVHAPKVR
jgi:hypothetical protein